MYVLPNWPRGKFVTVVLWTYRDWVRPHSPFLQDQKWHCFSASLNTWRAQLKYGKRDVHMILLISCGGSVVPVMNLKNSAIQSINQDHTLAIKQLISRRDGLSRQIQSTAVWWHVYQALHSHGKHFVIATRLRFCIWTRILVNQSPINLSPWDAIVIAMICMITGILLFYFYIYYISGLETRDYGRRGSVVMTTRYHSIRKSRH
jgi:hypothetical protein